MGDSFEQDDLADVESCDEPVQVVCGNVRIDRHATVPVSGAQGARHAERDVFVDHVQFFDGNVELIAKRIDQLLDQNFRCGRACSYPEVDTRSSQPSSRSAARWISVDFGHPGQSDLCKAVGIGRIVRT